MTKLNSKVFIPPDPLQSAVLFLVFNRPDTTWQVFEAIKQAKPPILYVSSDGPREGKPGEVNRVEAVRQIATAVDWPCEVKTLFRDKNLGCKQAISQAITWFFENEEQGIILEDDCLPNPDFFRFCELLLEKYKDDERVSVITGDNFQDGRWRGDASYYFSQYNHVWGWASWRRAWQRYDGDLSFWPEWKVSQDWKKKLTDPTERRYWLKVLDRTHAGDIDTWDYPWTGSVWYHGGLTVTPNVNLVSNIGFGEDSTHTKDPDSHLAGMETSGLGEINHPEIIAKDLEADRYTFDHAFGGKWKRFPYSWLRFPRRALGWAYRRLKRSFV